MPLVEHHIDQLSQVPSLSAPLVCQFQLPGLSEVLLIGFYKAEEFTDFISRCQQTYRISIKYLEESQPMGTRPADGH